MVDTDAHASASNAPEWTVSALSQALKATLEEAYGFVRVRGEISGYRGPHSSGHAYFALKDETAKIDAVIWRTSLTKLKVKPEEGMEVIAHGRLTTFPGKSSYQIVIERLEPAGLGALMVMLEERRRRLSAEGLFDEAHKTALPYLPATIGVITSPTGAVIRDILHRIADRFPRRVMVWPVRVQGETSAAEVARAIAGFNAMAPGGALPRPDLLIVARGGGSLEDLWSFNDEAVVRAAFASAIPLVSAIGHETDWTLLDHVADKRAPTPTGAAEMAVPVRAELLMGLASLASRLIGASWRGLERRRLDLRHLARGLPSGEALLAMPRQRLDLIGSRLMQALALDTRHHRSRYEAIRHRLLGFHPRAQLVRHKDRLDALSRRFESAARHHLLRRREGLYRLAGLLEAYSYHDVLKRGFALIRDAQGKPVRDAASAQRAGALDVQFADGHVRVRVKEEPSTKGKKSSPATQKNLFNL